MNKRAKKQKLGASEAKEPAATVEVVPGEKDSFDFESVGTLPGHSSTGKKVLITGESGEIHPSKKAHQNEAVVEQMHDGFSNSTASPMMNPQLANPVALEPVSDRPG